MGYSAKVILDSVSPNGNRLTTMEVTYPRFIHSEMMTHRLMSRNAASSRAIPVKRAIEAVKSDPVYPVVFGGNQKGMQAGEPVLEQIQAKTAWLKSMEVAVESAERLMNLGVHKQVVNRILEPYSWITVILSATDWDNFFKQRSSRFSVLAQPELAAIADMMLEAREASDPVSVRYGDWHMPYTWEYENLYMGDRKKISVARCARVSYLTHDGQRSAEKDLELYARLLEDGHWSPFEHVATPAVSQTPGNFDCWLQLRHMVNP